METPYPPVSGADTPDSGSCTDHPRNLPDYVLVGSVNGEFHIANYYQTAIFVANKTNQTIELNQRYAPLRPLPMSALIVRLTLFRGDADRALPHREGDRVSRAVTSLLSRYGPTRS